MSKNKACEFPKFTLVNEGERNAVIGHLGASLKQKTLLISKKGLKIYVIPR